MAASSPDRWICDVEDPPPEGIPKSPNLSFNPDLGPDNFEKISDEGEEGQEEDEDLETPQNPVLLLGMEHLTDSTSPASGSKVSNPRKGSKKRKKGAQNPRKLLLIRKKVESLMVKLNPIPFVPCLIPPFSKHEKLLKKLGLWDFVHIDFDRNTRVDLIAQLVATYDPKSKCSRVNDFRIALGRVDFANAFNLPLKKNSNLTVGENTDLSEELLDDSTEFISGFVSDWVLLHDDTWILPSEVINWLNLIKEGQAAKVDWAGMLRFMVVKELIQGDQLVDCYYASHLQHLLKYKRKELFLKEEDEVVEKLEVDLQTNEEVEGTEERDLMVTDDVEDRVEESCPVDFPKIELTLGLEFEKEENVREVEMSDPKKEVNGDCTGGQTGNDADFEEAEDDGGGEGNEAAMEVEDTEEKEQDQWLFHQKNSPEEHFLRPCSLQDGGQPFSSFNESEEEDREIDGTEGDNEEQRFDVFPTDDDVDGEGPTGNFLQSMEANEIPFNSQEQLRLPEMLDMKDGIPHMASSPSFFNNSCKRVIEHDDGPGFIPHSDNKRPRIGDSWSHQPLDFASCMDNIKEMTERSKILYAENVQELEQLNYNQQILLREVEKRDAVIEQLHKTRMEEVQRKDRDIYRLERELSLMGSVLDGYRKALKDTNRVFAEYRERAQLPEESIYKDAGPDGLMLSTTELEKISNEYKMNCSLVEQKLKEAEESCIHQLEKYDEKISMLNNKLTGLENEAKKLVQMCAKQMTQESEDNVAQVAPK